MSLKSTISRLAGRTGAQLSKHYPSIALVSGIAGVVGTVGLAIYATKKSDPIIRGHKADIHHTRERFKKQNNPYSPDQFKRDQVAIWTSTITDLTKLYAPTVALGAVSIAALVTGQHVLANRLNTMTLAYEGTRVVLENYRKAVTEEVGEERELEIYNNSGEAARERLIESGVIGEKDDEKGYDYYGTCFWFDRDASPLNYQESDMMNANFLRDVENAMNRRLQHRGHVFLNEVYEALGMPDTPLGTQIGWMNTLERKSFIDFGFDRKVNETVEGRIKEFPNGDHAFLLDLNVDGVIWNLL